MGHSDYSPVRVVEVRTESPSLALYPTLLEPAEALRYILQVPPGQAAGTELTVYSAVGQPVGTYTLDAGEPGILPLGALPTGWYLVKVLLTDGQVLTSRFGVR